MWFLRPDYRSRFCFCVLNLRSDLEGWRKKKSCRGKAATKSDKETKEIKAGGMAGVKQISGVSEGEE